MRRALVAEPVVFASIVLSTVAMCALGFTQPGSTAYQAWLAVDVACVAYFLLEAIVKMSLEGWRGYWAARWNRFDLLILVLSLPVMAAPLMSETVAFVGVPVLRLARLFRLFRLLRIIPERERLGAGVVRALRASVGVFLAIALVNFIFAMGAHVLFGHKSPEFFGTPPRAAYSMFKVFTVDGWFVMPDAVAAGSSEIWGVIARLYFGVAVLIGGILGLSLGNAVFVDQMVADNQQTMEHDVHALGDEIRNLREEIRALRADLSRGDHA